MFHGKIAHRVLALTLVFSFVLAPGCQPTPAATPTLIPPTATGTPTPTPIPSAVASLKSNLEGFPPTGAFVIAFNLPMKAESSANPIITFPATEGQTTWNDNYTSLTYQPSAPLNPGEYYTFFLDAGLLTSYGTSLVGDSQWVARVDSGPTVVSHMPEAGQYWGRQPTINIAFDRPMDQELTSRAFSIQPEVKFTTSWSDDRRMVINLLEPFQPDSRYDLILGGPGSTNKVTGADGLVMQQDYVWSYSLPALHLEVASLSDNSLGIGFNYQIDSQATGQPFSIHPPLSGEWTWVSAQNARFASAAPIPLGQQYTLSITSMLYDSHGPLQVEQKEYGFSAFPPVAIDVEKEYSYASITVSPVRVKFNVPVDHASAEKAFGISPSISGRFAWTGDPVADKKETLEFYPTRLFESNTAYTVTIEPSVTDTEGNRILVHPYETAFTTASSWYYYDITSFGWGSSVQAVNSEGLRKLQFGSPKNGLVRFDIYGYNLSEFSRYYANTYGTRRDWEKSAFLPVPGPEASPVATWFYTDTKGDELDETAIPVEVPEGLYILNLTFDGKLYDQLFVVLTSNAIVVKRSGTDLFAWVSNINGGSVPGAGIRVYSTRGEIVREGTADDNGIYRTTLPDDSNGMFVSAQAPGPDGEDVSISGLNSQWQTVIPYDLWSRIGSARQYMVYTYTDRPIYRPGQTVYFKAIVRQDDDAHYSLLPGGTPVTVNIRDSRSNLLETYTLTTNEFGTVNGSCELNQDVMLGKYSVEVLVNGKSQSQIFKVQDYRKPDYQITITPEDPEAAKSTVVGDTFKLNVQASYFFGEPVANAAITIIPMSLSRYYYSYSNPVNGDLSSYDWLTTSDLKIVTPAQTDENGQAQVEVTVKEIQDYERKSNWRSSSISAGYALAVTVNDGSQQEITRTFIFTAHSASEIIRVDNGGYFHSPREKFTVRMSAEDLSGQPVEGRELTLAIRQWDKTSFEFEQLVSTNTVKTDTSGMVSQEVSLEKGCYELQLTAQDSGHNAMTTSTYVYIFTSTDDWFNRTKTPITITPDQDGYKPYQTARFMIESTFSGPALVTFERGHVIHSVPIELTAPLTVFETQMIPEYAPNVFVAVNAWQPSEFKPANEYDYDYFGSNRPDSYLRLAYAEIQVDSDLSALQVNITTDKQTYSVGQPVNVTIDVRDWQGNSVRAEVSLAVVDEAIFSLSNELAQNIFSAFYSPRSLKVTTYDSMSPDRIIFDPGGRGGGGDGMGSEGGPRGEFLDTAVWIPTLTTDGRGRVTTSFDLPDNLTTWRLTAKAVTLKHQVGESTAKITTTKELLVRPILPRILTTGDQVELFALVHNNGEGTRSVVVSLESPGLEVLGDREQTIQLDPGEALPVAWNVKVLGSVETQVTVSAVVPEGPSDAVILSQAIQPAATQEIDTQSGVFNGNLRLVFDVPQFDPVNSQVVLQLHRSPAGIVLSGLDYLTGYPYGCVEQTMSRALPNAVVSRAADRLGLDPALRERVSPMVQASILRLYAFQHTGGGWGWWYDDASNDYQTAWVIAGFGWIQEAGYKVEPAVIDNGVAYLKRNLEEMDLRTRAYALYSMALVDHGDLDAMRTLVNDSLNDLDPFSQSALALAFQRMGQTGEAQKILDAIDKQAVQSGTLAYWLQPTSDGQYNRKTMASTVRTTALVMDAYVTIDPSNKLIPYIANYLLAQRRGRYGWGTTNETTFSILALTDYLLYQEQVRSDVSYQVNMNGELLQSGVLGFGKNQAALDLPLEKLQTGQNSITITVDPSSMLYYDFSSGFSVPMQEQIVSAGTVLVSRRYLDPSNNKPLQEVQVGQLVKVVLIVKLPSDSSFIMIEDHLPGGLEALNEQLNTANLGLTASGYGEDYESYFFRWENYGYNFKDIYGDRVVFFITDFEAGSRTLKYLARATFSGQFVALPAEASAMYDLNVWGHSGSTMLAIGK